MKKVGNIQVPVWCTVLHILLCYTKRKGCLHRAKTFGGNLQIVVSFGPKDTNICRFPPQILQHFLWQC